MDRWTGERLPRFGGNGQMAGSKFIAEAETEAEAPRVTKHNRGQRWGMKDLAVLCLEEEIHRRLSKMDETTPLQPLSKC